MTLRRHTPLRSRSAPKARKPVKRVNRKRKASEFARTYHSKARVAFVRSLPCAACGIEGLSANAHIGNEGSGAGMKANADQIGPLCDTKYRMAAGIPGLGCHQVFDVGPLTFATRFPHFDAFRVKRDTELRWLARVAAGGAA